MDKLSSEHIHKNMAAIRGKDTKPEMIDRETLSQAGGRGCHAESSGGRDMKQIEVVAAIIHDGEGRIFATQRGYGDYKDGWEFPGGKMEPGESPEEALKREIWEELETKIVVERLVQTVEYDYPQFHLKMHCFWCHIESGSLVLKEHEAARWLSKEQLNSVDWLPADKVVVLRNFCGVNNNI